MHKGIDGFLHTSVDGFLHTSVDGFLHTSVDGPLHTSVDRFLDIRVDHFLHCVEDLRLHYSLELSCSSSSMLRGLEHVMSQLLTTPRDFSYWAMASRPQSLSQLNQVMIEKV